MWSYVATKTPLVLLSVLISALTCRDVHAEYLAYVGDGRFLYQLDVVQDVWLERSNANYNNLDSLIVGEHLGFPLKRSLLQFEDLPADSGCDEVSAATGSMFRYDVMIGVRIAATVLLVSTSLLPQLMGDPLFSPGNCCLHIDYTAQSS